MVVKRCFVPKCPNTNINSKKIFLSVPRDENRRRLWLESIGIRTFTKCMLYCCEDHFILENDAENWQYYKTIGRYIVLKKDCIPHRNLYKTPTPKRAIESQESSTSKRRKFSTLQILDESRPGCSRELFPSAVVSVSENEDISQDVIPTSTYQNSPSGKFKIETVRCHKSIQVNLKIHKRSVGTNTETSHTASAPNIKNVSSASYSVSSTTTTKSSDSDTDFKMLSSTSSFDSNCSSDKSTFQAIVPLEIIERNSKFYTGIPRDTYYVVNLLCNKETKLTKFEVLLTLRKIKLDDPYKRLADDFKISVSKAGNIFRKTIPIMASCFQQLIFWPETHIIQTNLPSPFWFRYKNVQSLIDCFEVEIQKPSKPLIQSYTWSEYKKCNTLKYLVSSTPHGYINFCSGGFGGRTSDKVIFENCGFLNVLRNGTDVMADRGFKHVAAALAAKQCNLIRPPSVSASEKPTKYQVKESKRIAALRIHIERVIGRIRDFAILAPHARIHHQHIEFTDYIVLIVCGIINLQSSLIK